MKLLGHLFLCACQGLKCSVTASAFCTLFHNSVRRHYMRYSHDEVEPSYKKPYRDIRFVHYVPKFIISGLAFINAWNIKTSKNQASFERNHWYAYASLKRSQSLHFPAFWCGKVPVTESSGNPKIVLCIPKSVTSLIAASYYCGTIYCCLQELEVTKKENGEPPLWKPHFYWLHAPHGIGRAYWLAPLMMVPSNCSLGSCASSALLPQFAQSYPGAVHFVFIASVLNSLVLVDVITYLFRCSHSFIQVCLMV